MFVRTKDGIFDTAYLVAQETLPDVVGMEIADTPEELCDGFWWENSRYDDPIFIPNYLLVLDRIKAWKDSDIKLQDNSFERIQIYGSIYIRGKGWKHVGKINKETEKLELTCILESNRDGNE